jgi:hypothetical protein
MPRHTWTVRVELCETYDAVYAHAYLDNVPIHVTGRGQAAVTRQSDVVRGRGVATQRALADLSQAMRALDEHPSSGTHVREIRAEVEPGYSAAALAAATSSLASAVAN